MKKNKILIIITAIAVIALIIIIILALKEKNSGSNEEIIPTETPVPTQEILVPVKSEPVTISDVKYPFTIIPKDDGTMELEFVSEAPEGYIWQAAEGYISDYISVEKTGSKSYRFTGLLTAGTEVDIPLKTNDKYGITSCIITLNIAIGAENRYEQTGEIVENIDGEEIVLPILKTNGDETTGVSVKSYSEEFFDISDSLDGIIYSDVEEYASYHIDISEKETKFMIGVDSEADDWKFGVSGDRDVTKFESERKDGEICFTLKVNPRSEETESAEEPDEENGEESAEETKEKNDEDALTDVSGETDEPEDESVLGENEEDEPRLIIVNLYSLKDNVLLQINIEADKEGKSEVTYHYARIIDYGL